ncbi:MAG TPA: BrnT family toxin [Longimicrobium sp.]|nr:BrnT family toxin [Longimicrobium sp.]
MRFEWDWRKAKANLQKHRVRFEDAVGVFYDEQAVTVDDPCDEEERFVTIGMDNLGLLVVVVYTWRGEAIRLISARRATRNEARWYAAGDEP